MQFPSRKSGLIDFLADRSADPPEEDAASSDINKIIRPDYSDAIYARLAQNAVDEWTNNPTWKPYFHQSGSKPIS
jgi:sarcosine oxidase/L-pipecolate oxidase